MNQIAMPSSARLGVEQWVYVSSLDVNILLIPDTLFKDKSEAFCVMEHGEESQCKYPPRKEIYL